MIAINWIAVMLGVGVGSITSAAFFGGLAIGMRWALRSSAPVGLLAISAVVRIAGLIGIGWVVAQQGGPWAALGYAFAFFAARLIATTIARAGENPKAAL